MYLDVERICSELRVALDCLAAQPVLKAGSMAQMKATAHVRIALLLLSGSQFSHIVGVPKEEHVG